MSATVMPERTSARTVVDQCTHPVAASRAYTVPSCAPAKMRPRYTAGCDRRTAVSGNANTHLGASFGTSAAVSPAAAADWKRELLRPGAQLAQLGPSFHSGALVADAAGQGLASSS